MIINICTGLVYHVFVDDLNSINNNVDHDNINKDNTYMYRSYSTTCSWTISNQSRPCRNSSSSSVLFSSPGGRSVCVCLSVSVCVYACVFVFVYVCVSTLLFSSPGGRSLSLSVCVCVCVLCIKCIVFVSWWQVSRHLPRHMTCMYFPPHPFPS